MKRDIEIVLCLVFLTGMYNSFRPNDEYKNTFNRNFVLEIISVIEKNTSYSTEANDKLY